MQETKSLSIKRLYKLRDMFVEEVGKSKFWGAREKKLFKDIGYGTITHFLEFVNENRNKEI